MKLLNVNGFDIKVDPSWLLIAALITWALSRHYFPTALPDRDVATYLVMALVTMLCFFASLVLHELAHSLVARRFGVPIKNITLFLFGGVAELEAEPQSARVEFWIAVAGPVMSLCLGLSLWISMQVSLIVTGATALTEVLSYLALINVVLAVFNLVPAFPLDGGRILRALLWHRSGDVLRATATAARSGAIFAYALMGLGVLALFQGGLMTGLWNIMIGLFILGAARASYQQQLAKVAFENKTVGDLMQSDPITVDPNASLDEFVNRIMLGRNVSFVPVVENGVLLGHMDPKVLADIDRENWTNTQVGDVFAGLEDASTISPDVTIEALFKQISGSGCRKYMVVKGRQLVGVISLSDLTRFLNLSDRLLRHGEPRDDEGQQSVTRQPS
ncbi:site-2 protease family protein [Tateyamaria sp. SN3-11]|uniref:site-2 protease family protein n=1 Tax=Tateyamaria sp. SN3-11 TaxID=3092147 RepID=UPI0039EAFD97